MADDKKFELVGGSVAIVSTGKKTEQKVEAFEEVLKIQTGEGTSMEDLFDRFTKLIYLVDASGSMGDGMKSEDKVGQFSWTPAVLKQFRDRMKDENSLRDGIEGEDEEGMLQASEDAFDLSMSDDELKKVIVDQSLDTAFGIHLPLNPRAKTKSRSKMRAVKDAAREFVSARYKKYPDARVLLFAFEQTPYLLSGGATEKDVLEGIDRLPDYGGGGTDILAAVKRGVEECKKRPSEVGAHHLVLVSDGLDYGAMGVRHLLPTMKEIGIVFDFIFIQGATEGLDESVIRALREVCEATGGEFIVVKTEKDFQQKFLAVSTRKCLPPARV